MITKNEDFNRPVRRLLAGGLKRGLREGLAALLLCAALALPLHAAGGDEKSSIAPAVAEPAETSLTNAAPKSKHWEPGPNDGRIALTVATMLEQFHYLHLKFSPDVSSKMLDLCLNWYDPQHIHFLQSDLAEFEKYRYKLGELTKEKHDTTPAYVIFNRFMERLEQRSAYAKELLRNEPFVFTNNERMSLNRKNAPFPKDLDEARQLWRERVRYEYLEEKLNRESPRQLASLFTNRVTPVEFALVPSEFHDGIVKFVDTRYNRVLRNFHDWDNEKVLERYLTELACVYDPHSDYEDRETLENFSIQMSLSLFGIGAVLSTDDDGYCKIVSLQKGAPADRSGKINPGDRIVAVAQGAKEPVDVVQMPLDKVVAMIRGVKGTPVKLTLIPADSATRKTVELVRDEIKLEEQQAKAKLIEMPNGAGVTQRLGVIELPSFYATFPVMGARGRPEIKSATMDVDRLLTKLKQEHVDGVILDLRHNGGGSLPEAIDLTGLFIKEGPVVQVASADGSVQVDEDQDPRIQYDGPLVVLADRFSASASEIVAGALQDYGRAVVVGSASTHGKGTVQSITQLAPYLFATGEYVGHDPAALGALKYTTNAFYRVTGVSTQLRGVVPDIVLPCTYDYMETEEGSEDYAMKLKDIDSTRYDKLDRVQPYLPELEKRSAKRVAASKDFDYVREDVETVKKAMADKSVTLNEAQRLKESEEAEARKKVRDAELKSRKPSLEKIYDLTLKNGAVEMAEEKTGDSPLAALNSKPTATNGVIQSLPAISGTNIPLASAGGKVDASGKPVAPPEPPSPEETAPLDEAEHVLLDYISLLRSGGALTAEQQRLSPTQAP